VTSGTGVQQRDERGAEVSDDGLYRYSLWRRWGEGAALHFVMLNPSTADAVLDDPTIRRCIGFAKREGFAALSVTNLYALRATNPQRLLDLADPAGPQNLDRVMATVATGPIVVAWGGGAMMKGLAPSLVKLWLMERAASDERVLCLGVTATNQPRHPLYIRGDHPLEVWIP
jgi:hypothetical protein